MFKTADKVRVTFSGRRLEADVLLASENGHSLVLAFDGLLGGYVGLMPVLLADDGRYLDLLHHDEVGIEKSP